MATAGLEGVVVADTEIGGVRGDEGFFHYRQFSAPKLAATRTLEEVWYLLLFGSLPDAQAAESFGNDVGRLRTVAPSVIAAMRPALITGSSIPALNWLRSAVSIHAQSLDLQPCLGRDRAEIAGEAQRLAAAVPTLVAAGWRLRHGLEPLPPDPGRGVAADLLSMLTGTEPSPVASSALETYLTLTIDHGFNASTFAARVVVSTGADLGSGMVAAIGALSGPLHGGAPSHVLAMLTDIGSIDRAQAWIEGALHRGERIMGFGHRVYRTEDPRSAALREAVLSFDDPIVDLAVGVERLALEALGARHPDREIRTNVEYYAGVLLHLIGIPAELFPACFAASRSIGWSVHMLEQIAQNRIIRPSARYVGPPAPVPVP